jgi:hypothetical protein
MGPARLRTRAPARAAARAPRGPVGPTAHRQSQQRPLDFECARQGAALFKIFGGRDRRESPLKKESRR